MATSKPFHAREPYCLHSGNTQPASMCDVCADGPAMLAWREQWALWLAENPDSLEAAYVRELDASRERGDGCWWNDPVQKGNVLFRAAVGLPAVISGRGR